MITGDDIEAFREDGSAIEAELLPPIKKRTFPPVFHDSERARERLGAKPDDMVDAMVRLLSMPAVFYFAFMRAMQSGRWA